MLISGLLGMLTGFVEFTAEGGFPERFINLCSLEGIPLNGLYCSKGIITGKTSVNGYKKMRSAAKRSGMRMRIRNKKGLPFFIRKNKNRAGILAGAAVFAALTVFLSTRIWSIEVEGNVLLSDEEIISVFEELGVHTGAAKRSLDTKKIQEAAARKIDKALWTSLNLDGSTAVIEIREITQPSGKKSDGVPCNIIASREGAVEIIEAYMGKAEVKKGDGVRKGSLLVSGVTENLDGSVTLRSAEAYVAALTERNFSSEVPLTPEVKKVELRKTVRFLHILGIKIPLNVKLGKAEGCPVYESERSLSANGKKLPVGILTKRYTEAFDTAETLTEDRAALEAYEKIMHQMTVELFNVEIRACSVRQKTSEDVVRLSAAVSCLENIGRRSKIDLSETGASSQ